MNHGPKQRLNSQQFFTALCAVSRMLNPLTRSLQRVGYLSPRRAPLTSQSVLTSLGALHLLNTGILYSMQKK